MDESDIADNLLPPPPERIGPYRIENRLGVGGMGAVYRAFDERLERPVAVKHILPELADNERAWKRLRREAKTVAKLNHPAIVQIYDILEHDTGDWIVMELVDGDTLFSMVKDGPLELSSLALDVIAPGRRRAGRRARQGHRASGSQDRERHGRPARARVKILDFGLAKNVLAQGGRDQTLSIEGSILGTGRAMSPEQALGDEVDHRRSDLFSLGSLIYEVVTGRAAVRPVRASFGCWRRCARIRIRRRGRSIRRDARRSGRALIDRLLEKDPEEASGQMPTEVLAVLQAIDPGADAARSRAPEGAASDAPGSATPARLRPEIAHRHHPGRSWSPAPTPPTAGSVTTPCGCTPAQSARRA